MNYPELMTEVLYAPQSFQAPTLDALSKEVKRSIIYDLQWKCGNINHMIKLLYIFEFSDDNHIELYKSLISERIGQKYYSSSVITRLDAYNYHFQIFHDLNSRDEKYLNYIKSLNNIKSTSLTKNKVKK